MKYKKINFRIRNSQGDKNNKSLNLLFKGWMTRHGRRQKIKTRESAGIAQNNEERPWQRESEKEACSIVSLEKLGK